MDRFIVQICLWPIKRNVTFLYDVCSAQFTHIICMYKFIWCNLIMTIDICDNISNHQSHCFKHLLKLHNLKAFIMFPFYYTHARATKIWRELKQQKFILLSANTQTLICFTCTHLYKYIKAQKTKTRDHHLLFSCSHNQYILDCAQGILTAHLYKICLAININSYFVFKLNVLYPIIMAQPQ